MINVLWAVPVSDMGGVARHTRDVFANGIPGCRPHLLVPPGPFALVAESAGFDVTVGSFGPEFGLAQSVRTLRETAVQVSAKIVHSHLAFADFVASTARRCAIVSTEHGIALDDSVYHETRAASRAMEQAHRLRLRRVDALIAVSHATEKAIRAKWSPPRSLPIEVIANGVDPAPATVVAPGAGLHFVTLSRLSPEKGLHTLVDAFAIVVAKFGDARLTIAGDGPMRAELCAHVEDLGIADAVAMPGFVDGIDKLGPAHVVVQLSVWENCSYALLDALRAKCGVVATDVGGNAELLPRRCLVPLDDPQAAAQAMMDQALHVDQRPGLRDGWPSVSDMCAALASTYERVAV